VNIETLYLFRSLDLSILKGALRWVAVLCLTACAFSAQANVQTTVNASEIKGTISTPEQSSIVLLGLVSLVVIRRRKLWLNEVL
jgi:hypothetical protein